MINDKTIEIIEEIGKIPMSTIDNVEQFISELDLLGYSYELSPNTDYLLVKID